MYGLNTGRFYCEMKQVVREASRGLACLDVDRLEELARCCEMLNSAPLEPAETARQAREASREMILFARVLDATRANLEVMRRLRDLRQSRAGYGDSVTPRGLWSEAASGND